MKMPTALRSLDDRVLGRKGDKGSRRGHDEHGHDGHGEHGHATDRSDAHGAADGHGAHDDVYPEERTSRTTRERRPAEDEGSSSRPAGDVVREVLGVVWTVARYVFLALALVVALGIVLEFAPTNDGNSLVSTVMSWADWAAGPFRDVFTADTARRELLYNYGLATAVYLLAASLVGKLPGKRGVS